MLSILLELLGFGAFVAAAYLIGGVDAGLVVLGVVLLLVGLALDGTVNPPRR